LVHPSNTDYIEKKKTDFEQELRESSITATSEFKQLILDLIMHGSVPVNSMSSSRLRVCDVFVERNWMAWKAEMRMDGSYVVTGGEETYGDVLAWGNGVVRDVCEEWFRNA
jgi:hypothetical protein